MTHALTRQHRRSIAVALLIVALLLLMGLCDDGPIMDGTINAAPGAAHAGPPAHH